MNEGNDELVFVPLGGVGEIGMNLALYWLWPQGTLEMADGRLRAGFRRPRSRGDRPRHPGHTLSSGLQELDVLLRAQAAIQSPEIGDVAPKQKPRERADRSRGRRRDGAFSSSLRQPV
jgi:hypothetical protein